MLAGNLGGSAGYRYREIIFHSARLSRNAALRNFASLSSGRNRKTHDLPQECAHRWSDITHAGPPGHRLGLLCPCRPVRDLRTSPTIRTGTFHSSTTALVSSQSARSAVGDGRGRTVDCLPAGAWINPSPLHLILEPGVVERSARSRSAHSRRKPPVLAYSWRSHAPVPKPCDSGSAITSALLLDPSSPPD